MNMFFPLAVVPHITDAIQDWVDQVSKKPVTTDNLQPEVGT